MTPSLANFVSSLVAGGIVVLVIGIALKPLNIFVSSCFSQFNLNDVLHKNSI